MCGILGFSLKHPITTGDIEHGLKNLECLEHRGPDGQGHAVFSDYGVFIGHRRLAILDLSDNASQPMTRDELTVAHNGEIYNFLEIRKNLESKGINFSTNSDTEVLIKAWAQSGPKCLQSFDGMFAFTLFDGKNTHLATDPFGEKPLYVYENEDGVYYASEPSPLIKMLGIKFNPSESEIAAFLTLGFIPAPATGFKNLQLLPPGSHAVISEGKIINITQYWTPEIPKIPKGKPVEVTDNELDLVADALVESVRVRLRSDVQMATFLSSGVDSALVAAITAKELQVDIPAITVGFPNTDVADESIGASDIAQHLGLEHQIVQHDGAGGRDPLSLIINLYDCAIDNPTVIPAFHMSSIARASATVALSGVGGDEIFYGYNRYQLFYKHRKLLSLSGTMRKLCGALLDITGHKPVSALLNHSPNWTYANFKNVGVLDILDSVPYLKNWADGYFDEFESPHFRASRHFDLTSVLPNSFIPAIERASMRTGLEVRTPFLNKKLLKVVDQMDPRSLIAFGQKNIARRLLKRYIPEHLILGGKRGFNSPLDPIIKSHPDKPKIPGINREVVETSNSRKFDGRGRELFVRLIMLERLIGQNTR